MKSEYNKSLFDLFRVHVLKCNKNCFFLKEITERNFMNTDSSNNGIVLKKEKCGAKSLKPPP